MATRARFGRIPRSAPSLTSTIVALAQEYQRTRDRNIEEAWKNGGLFEGKKVTDDAFLKHWKDRLSELDPQDPMWDEVNNLIYGYEFTIDESKMGLKYARGDVNEAQMSAFYKKWANKMPVNSQNYRMLMTQAAKFKASVTARGNGSRAAAAAKAYSAKQQKTYDRDEAAYDVATQTLTRYAVNYGILDPSDVDKDAQAGWEKLTSAAGENDASAFIGMLNDLKNDTAIVYTDKDGKKYTQADLMVKHIQRFDPNFEGEFTEESLARLANNARNGANERARRARANGSKTDANAAEKAAARYARSSMVIRSTMGGDATKGFIEQEQSARAELDSIIAPNSGASPMERQAAVSRYQKWLAGDGMAVLNSTFSPTELDPMSDDYNVYAAGLMGRVGNTLNATYGKSTGLTLKDDPLATSESEAGPSSDSYFLATTTSGLISTLDNVAAGNSIVVRVNDQETPDPNGGSWAVFARGSEELNGYDIVPFVAPVTGSYVDAKGNMVGGENGEIRYTVAKPVKVREFQYRDPATGALTNEIDTMPGRGDEIGSRVTIIGPGGSPIDLWGVMAPGPDGEVTRVWTSVNPFSAEGTISTDKDGSTVFNYVSPPKMVGGKVVPGQTYDPQARIVPGIIKVPVNGTDGKQYDPTDGLPWDPEQDKQTAWGSPLAAYANSSSEAMKHMSSLGTTAVKNAEREFYSQPENWTAKMKAQFAATQDAEAVIELAADELMRTVQYNQTYGYTPEDQSASLGRYKAKWNQMVATSRGFNTPGEMQKADAADDETAYRSELAAKVTKWGQSQRPMAGPLSGPGVSNAQTQQGTSTWTGKGWAIQDLLNQPGMSRQQADDLAYQITRGAAGVRGAPLSVEGRAGGSLGAGSGPRSTQQRPYVNPYLTPTGAVPARTGPAQGYRPPLVQPKPTVVAKPPPEAFKTPPNTGINAATGFTVPVVKRSKQVGRTAL